MGEPQEGSEEHVFALLEAGGVPIGAYALARRISIDTGRRHHANSVYRALDKLIAAGRVIHIASLKAYVAAQGGLGGKALILLCTACGSVGQVEAGTLSTRLRSLASTRGFRPRRMHIELSGRCRSCPADPDQAEEGQ